MQSCWQSCPIVCILIEFYSVESTQCDHTKHLQWRFSIKELLSGRRRSEGQDLKVKKVTDACVEQISVLHISNFDIKVHFQKWFQLILLVRAELSPVDWSLSKFVTVYHRLD